MQDKLSTILMRLIEKVPDVLDMPALMSSVMSVLKDVLGYKNCAIYLDDGETETLVLMEAVGLRAQLKGVPLPRNDGIINRALEHRAVRLVSNVAQDALARESTKMSSGAMLVASLVAQDRAIGVLVIESELADAYTAEDVQLLEAIAPPIAAMLEVAQQYKMAKVAAIYDGLTTIYNQRYFYERLAEEMSRAARLQHPLSVAVIDVDGLKQVNDTYGHLAGDEALKSLAANLREAVRASDVVARYGGDEFAVILLDTDKAGAERAMNRITATIRKTMVKHRNLQFPMPATSWGVASFPQDGSLPQELFAAADRVLYESRSRR